MESNAVDDPNAKTNQESAPEVLFSGDSFLLRLVIRCLKDRYNISIPLLPTPGGESSLSRTLIHDGAPTVDQRACFAIDFDIRDYGTRPDVIAECLWERLTAGLV